MMNGPFQGLSTQPHQMPAIFSLFKKKKIKLTLRVKLSFGLRPWFLVVAVVVWVVYCSQTSSLHAC